MKRLDSSKAKWYILGNITDLQKIKGEKRLLDEG
jgi:hypothetical protein